MDKVALVGHPAAGTLWPQAVAALSRLLDREVKYKVCDVDAARLPALTAKLKEEGFAGINVLSPYKRTALALAGSTTGEAKAIGALNCLKWGGESKGHNTEAVGLYDALSDAAFKARDSTCQVLGGGFAARAAAYALGRAGARTVRIWARKPAQAETIAHELKTHWPDTQFAAGLAGPAELWINATPLGSPGFPDKPPVKALAGAVMAVDLVCGRPTKFLALGGAARARCLTGATVLVCQAIRSWELWFGPVGGPGRGVLKADVMRLKRWR